MYEPFELVDWRTIRWSDECSIELGKGEQGGWVFITSAEQRLDPKYVQTRRCGKQKTQMFWAAFGHNIRTPLVVMERDQEAKKKGYTARIYRQVLDTYLAQILTSEDDIFMHDNAPIHTAKIILAWLEEHLINIIKWPPYSPDLNPIENLWAILKREIYKYFPELLIAPDTEQTKLELIAAAQHIWEGLGDQIIKNLADSMPNRIQAVIRAEGWYTKY